MPQGMTFPKPPETKDENGETVTETTNEADTFMRVLAEGMLTPIEDPSSPAAMVPIVVTAPDESIDKAKLVHFWSNLDEQSMPLRAEAIRRFALGMDLPPEELLGMSSNTGTGGGTSNGVSHWGAWQIEESAIKMHVEPMLQLVVNALTVGYLRPLLEGDSDTRAPEFIHYDTSALRLRPDRSKEASELYDRGELSAEAMRRENGFSEEDAPDDKAFKFWLLKKVASGSATPEQVAAALSEFGIVVPGASDMSPRESRPDPSLEDHPVNPRTPDDLAASALLAASDALVWRALERAGNRIRQNAGIKPPGVPAYSMHTMVQVNGQSDQLLADAWSCAPQVLDGMCDVEATVQSLNSYVRMLFHEQSEHSRERLRSWLSTKPVLQVPV
jgi:hypothetical protein